MHKRIVIGLYLLLATLTAVAHDSIPMRSCRPQTATHAVSHRKAPRRTVTANPYVGERRQLTVLASFQDKTFQDSEPLAVWNKILNTRQLDEAPFHGSVHDYFADQSYGQLQLTFDLHEVTLPDSLKRYRSTSLDDENSKYMVCDIVDALQAEDIDWSAYDWDGDGYINQLLIIYAGMGMNDGGGYNTIWPHQWWLSERINCEPREVTSNGQTYLVDSYCCVQELASKDTHSTFGTICHEYSHCFGLPDFYNGSISYLRDWDLMDYGNNNGNGFCPAGYSAHERMLMGWLQPTELTADTTVAQIPQLADEPVAYLVRNDGYDQEYYIIENRQQSGWDAELPGSGILIFHIDYDKDLWISTTEAVNTNQQKRYYIIPANNGSVYSCANWGYPYKSNNALTNTSVPAATLLHANSDGTKQMSKPITEMLVTDGLASFHFKNDMVSGVQREVPSADAHRQYFSLQGHALGTDLASLPCGIYIVRDAQGKTKKIIKR